MGAPSSVPLPAGTAPRGRVARAGLRHAAAALGAFALLAVVGSLAVHVAPVAELFSIYIVMTVVLMFRPEGLFQRTQARKI